MSMPRLNLVGLAPARNKKFYAFETALPVFRYSMEDVASGITRRVRGLRVKSLSADPDQLRTIHALSARIGCRGMIGIRRDFGKMQLTLSRDQDLWAAEFFFLEKTGTYWKAHATYGLTEGEMKQALPSILKFGFNQAVFRQGLVWRMPQKRLSDRMQPVWEPVKAAVIPWFRLPRFDFAGLVQGLLENYGTAACLVAGQPYPPQMPGEEVRPVYQAREGTVIYLKDRRSKAAPG